MGHQKAACPFRRGDASGGSGSGGSPGVVEKGKSQKGKGHRKQGGIPQAAASTKVEDRSSSTFVGRNGSVIERVENVELVHLFVDGSCQHQAHPDIRVSSGSVVRVQSHAEFEVVWSGMTPSSDQQSLRGEILAGCVATASYRKCWIYTDNSTFWSSANAMVSAVKRGLAPSVPKDHPDLWIFFIRCLQGSDLDNLSFVKVKGHLDWRTQSTEYLRWTAWYNNLADLAAKRVLIIFREAYPEYVNMCRRYFRDLKRAEALALYHVDIAEFATSGVENGEVDEFDIPVMLQTIGEIIRGPIDIFPLDVPAGFNHRFIRRLQTWACNLTIYKYSESGFEDTSWLECFLIFLDFDLLWRDLRRFNEGHMMLADCQFFQDDDWIRWESGGTSGTLRLVEVQKVGISIQTANSNLFFPVPFHPGLLMQLHRSFKSSLTSAFGMSASLPKDDTKNCRALDM